MSAADDSPRLLVSVIMVAFNSEAVIARTIAAVQEHLPDAEIVVVDNGSSDGSAEIARRAAPDLTLVQGHGNVGFGGGVNRGAEAARGDLIFILNVDAPPTWVDRARLRDLAHDERLGLATCAVREGGKTAFPVYPQHGWPRELLWIMARAFLMPRELGFSRRVVPAGSDGAWLGGVALLAGREEFRRLGGFDERFFLYSEDRDLSHTYSDAGLPLRTVAAVRVEHRGEEYSPSPPVEQVAWGLLSLVEYVGKWEGRGAAARCAASTLRALALIERSGRLLGSIPGLQPRALAAAEKARRVRRLVLAIGPGDARAGGSYEIAREVLAAAR